jgi:hypothetical protein
MKRSNYIDRLTDTLPEINYDLSTELRPKHGELWFFGLYCSYAVKTIYIKDIQMGWIGIVRSM